MDVVKMSIEPTLLVILFFQNIGVLLQFVLFMQEVGVLALLQ